MRRREFIEGWDTRRRGRLWRGRRDRRCRWLGIFKTSFTPEAYMPLEAKRATSAIPMRATCQD